MSQAKTHGHKSPSNFKEGVKHVELLRERARPPSSAQTERPKSLHQAGVALWDLQHSYGCRAGWGALGRAGAIEKGCELSCFTADYFLTKASYKRTINQTSPQNMFKIKCGNIRLCIRSLAAVLQQRFQLFQLESCLRSKEKGPP